MKVSLNLAQYYANVDLKSIPRDELLERIGAQLGAIESIEDFNSKYEGIVVVKVVECIKHPAADKLSLCRIDDGVVTSNVERGEDKLVQVVCGASNVKAGMFAVWIPPGITVPSTIGKDALVMEPRELRGQMSNGMLASPAELDMSDEHSGILELDPKEINNDIFQEARGSDLQPGDPISKFFGLDDFVIDCENKMFTHRPDCFGNLGVARELAGICGLRFQSPEWYLNAPNFMEESQQLPLDVSNEIPQLVPRFSGVVMSDLKVGPSPLWLQQFLRRIDIKSINNIVDVTNYVMHLTGQPLHAFDYDKLVNCSLSPSLTVRAAKDGEEISLLNGKSLVLTHDDLVLATDKQAVDVAGIMGGSETEIGESTKSIVLSCATFDMYTVRRTSMKHGLFTDAATRFTKGQSPLQNDRVLAFAMKMLTELAGARPASPVYDLCSFDKNADNLSRVKASPSFINSRLGVELSTEEIKRLLENVEFTVEIDGEDLLVTAPFWRMDIAIAEDLVEEVGRLHGYSNLQAVLPLRSTKPAERNYTIDFAHQLRQQLKGTGANELLTYSFVKGELLHHCGIDPDKWAYHLRNALSPELQYYRPSLLPSLLTKVHSNSKTQAGQEDNEFALYEIGKVHVKNVMEEDQSNLPKQLRRLALVYAADSKAALQHGASAYYQAKRYLDFLTGGQASYELLDSFEDPFYSPFQRGRSGIVKLNDTAIGAIGEFSARVRKQLKLPTFSAGFEIDLDLLREQLPPREYNILPLFPSSYQDMTFEIGPDLSYGQLVQFLQAELAVAAAEDYLVFNLAPLDIFKAEDTEQKRISFRIEIAHRHKTLTTQETNMLCDQLAKVAHEDLKINRV